MFFKIYIKYLRKSLKQFSSFQVLDRYFLLYIVYIMGNICEIFKLSKIKEKNIFGDIK